LQYLHDYFHNWLLAFAAYNAGIGTVMKAVAYNKAHNKPTDFWSLPLPAETKAYVPKLLALSTILANPKQYKLKTYPVANQPYFTAVKTNVPITLNHVAKLAEANPKTIQNLNAGIKSPNAKPNTTYNILIPIAHISQFQKGIQSHLATNTDEKQSQNTNGKHVELAHRRSEHVTVSHKTRIATKSSHAYQPTTKLASHSGLNFPVAHGMDFSNV
jgi:membrane-bound lytic murein transglycosylase D